MAGMKLQAKRLLLIADCFPYPPDNADRARVYRIIKTLEEYFDIYLICFTADFSNTADTYQSILRQDCREVHVFPREFKWSSISQLKKILKGRSIWQEGIENREAHKTLRDISLKGVVDVVIGCSAATLGYVQTFPRSARIMDMVKLESQQLYQQSQTRWLLGKKFSLREAAAMEQLEKNAIEGTDASIFASSQEAMKAPGFSNKIQVIPNGVDTAHFHPAETVRTKPYSIIFAGDLDNADNVEGLMWFVDNVWSKVKVECMKATLWVVGRNPAKQIEKLKKMEGVHVRSSVNDIRPFYDSASIAIAPVRSVHGTVLESMAMGLPTIGTPQALNGYDFARGVEIFQAETASQWQYAIKALFIDKQYYQKISQSARTAVVQRYQWSKFEESFRNLIDKLLPDGFPYHETNLLKESAQMPVENIIPTKRQQPNHVDIFEAFEEEFGQ